MSNQDGYSSDGYFSFDSNVYPPLNGTGNSVLKDTDSVNQKILEFARGVLQSNLGSRWAQECLACGMTNSAVQNLKDGYIVGDAICYPPPATLKQTDYKFPLLSVYRERDTFRQGSTHHVYVESDFHITWTLPPLANPNQANHLYPFLELVSKTVFFFGMQGSNSRYNNGELVWNEAGFAFGLFQGAEFGSFLGNDGKTIFPSVQISFKVFERNQFVAANFEPLQGFDGTISHTDGYNINEPIEDFIEFVANPSFSVTKVSPQTGSILGNTLVSIEGTGFLEAGLQLQSQITFAGQAVQNFKVKSDSLILAVTGYTEVNTVGPVTITDNNGNSVSSTQTFKYVGAPTIQAIDKSLGDASGGTVVTITVDDSAGIVSGTICGSPIVNLQIISPTQVRGTTTAMQASATPGDVIIVNGLGTSAPLAGAFEAFYPTNIADLTQWLRADMGVTGTDSVTSWADQSGSGWDMGSSAFPTTVPTLSTGINGKPSLLFGSQSVARSSRLDGVTPASMLETDQADGFVIMLPTVTGQNHLWMYGGPGTDEYLPLAGGQVYESAFNSTRPPAIVIAADIEPILYEVSNAPNETANTYRVAYNNQIFDDPTNTPYAIKASTTLGMGTIPVGYGNWQISEVIVFKRVLTDSERNRIKLYKSDRYNF